MKAARHDAFAADVRPFPRSGGPVERTDGCPPLDAYAALGEGRSVTLSGADGSIDWWCCPDIDGPALFDRLLDPERGVYFAITPDELFTVEIGYREGTNVHETVFTTASGKARLTDCLNHGPNERMPWAELARRVEGIEGRVRFRFDLVFGTRGGTAAPFLTSTANGTTFHVARMMGLFRASAGVRVEREDHQAVRGHVEVTAGQREIVAVVAGEGWPLAVPPPRQIDERIDVSSRLWREWTDRLDYSGRDRPLVVRSLLVLRTLLYTPTGAIAAAATTSLPEGLGGAKNWDYRYAWARDAGYVIKAFLRLGLHTWTAGPE